MHEAAEGQVCLSNIVFDVTHIGGKCKVCGLPTSGSRSTVHPECRRALDALKKRLRRKQRGRFDEIAYRFEVICENVEWILKHSSREVHEAIGTDGEDALLAFHTRRKECTR